MWGKGNLLMQYLFQCNCPTLSEQARYKPFKVVSSPCSEPYLLGFSPSGRYILLSEQRPQQRAIRLDMQTGESLDISFIEGRSLFLNDDLLFSAVDYPGPHYFLTNLNDKVQIEIPNAQTLEDAIPTLKMADRVWVTDDTFTSYPYVVGIVNDYQTHIQNNIALIWEGKSQELHNKLRENNIQYETIDPPFFQGPEPFLYRYSPVGRNLYSDYGGVYLSTSGQRVVASGQQNRSTALGDRGWVLGDHAVIYGGGFDYLLNNSGSPLPLIPSMFPVPFPILLLEVPPQYWAENNPTPTIQP
jgi:hypothetical protein